MFVNLKLVNRKLLILSFVCAIFVALIFLLSFTYSSKKEIKNNNYLDATSDVKTLSEKVSTASGIKNNGSIYYYNGSDANNNMIFADICWQIVRTTENDGVKLIYNGVPVDGECTSSTNYIGSSAYNSDANKITSVGYMHGDYDYGKVQFLTDEQATIWGSNIMAGGDNSEGSLSYIYGTGATWDEAEGVYYLEKAKIYSNMFSDMMMASTHKYTCFTTGDTSVYNGEETDRYNCGSTVYIAIGSGTTSASYVSLPSKISYDSDDYYYLIEGFKANQMTDTGTTITWAFSNSVTLNSNNKYVLNDATTYNMANWGTDHSAIDSYHYTCFRVNQYNSTNVECERLYYVFYSGEAGLYYFEIDPLDNIDLSLLESETYLASLLANNSNSSIVKSAVDNWYSTTFTASNKYTQYLLDSEYCNDRDISDSGGWLLNNSVTGSIAFSAVNRTSFSLSCSSEDTLTGKIGLLSYDEALMAGVTSSSVSYFGSNPFWLMTPYSYKEEVVNTIESVDYYDMASKVYLVASTGLSSSNVDSTNYVRPVISVDADIPVIGTGTPEDPIKMSFSVTYEIGDSSVTGVTIPDVLYYGSGDNVTVDTSLVVGNVYNGYVFNGWTSSDVIISNGAFTMPDNDVVLTGTWSKVVYITPVIDVIAISTANVKISASARFTISVTNDEDYEITDVYISVPNAAALSCASVTGFSCTEVDGSTLRIASIPAHQTYSTSYAYAYAAQIGTVSLEAIVTNASASAAIFDTSKEYKDSDSATTTAGVEICNVLDGAGDGAVYQYYIEELDSSNTKIAEHWIVLDANTCTSVALNTGSTYTLFQLDKQENTLISVEGGLISSNGESFVLSPKEYSVTFYNEYNKKNYFHGWDRVENDVTFDFRPN